MKQKFRKRAFWIWRNRPVPPVGSMGIFIGRQMRPHEAERNRFVYFRKNLDTFQ